MVPLPAKLVMLFADVLVEQQMAEVELDNASDDEPKEGDGFQPLPSRRRRYVVPPWRIGSISQHTKTRQAIRDARNK